MARKNRPSDFPSDPSQDAGGEDASDYKDESPDPMQDILNDPGMTDDEKDAAIAEKVAERMQIFGAKLASKRDEWVRSRAAQGIDRRWVEDLDQFNGKDNANRAAANMMTSVEQGFPVTSNNAKSTRSTVFVPLTRQKTNMAVARLGDITLPTDDLNFSIQPTPLPRLPSFVTVPGVSPTPVAQAASQAAGGGLMTGAAPAAPAGPAPGAPNPTSTMPGAPTMTAGSMAGSTGMQAPTGAPQSEGATAAQPGIVTPPPVDPSDPDAAMKLKVLAQQAVAKEKADAMSDEIDDCFDECDFNAEQRKAQFNMGLFGVGVLKGPIAIKTCRKAWLKRTDQVGHPYWVLDVQEDLNPHSFSIDPRNIYPDPACGDDVQNGRGIFELEKKSPKQVRELGKQPEYLKQQLVDVLLEGPQVGRAITQIDQDDTDTQSDEIFEHWVYWGEVDRDDLIAAGAMKPTDSESVDDKLRVVSACVEMINSTVVRAYLNPYSDESLPYDMIPWERVPGSVWGYGIPYLMRAQQRVINTAWRMILDNAGVSSGPQIVIKPGVIQPADKQWTITSRKIWYAKDSVDDVKTAFATFEFNMHLDELSKIIELAQQFVDEGTAVPAILQGATAGASGPAKTSGQAQIEQAGANVALKRLVKQYDDCGIKPHVRRYYDYLMEYSDKEEIKGDFQIVALGSSSLIVKDIENQAITNMLALASNPAYSMFIDRKKLFEKALRAQHIDPLDVMNSDAEIQKQVAAAAQQQPPDPRIQAATIVADTNKAKIASSEAIAQKQLDAEAAKATSDREMRIQELQIERDIEILRASQKENTTVAQVKAQLAAVAIKERATTERQIMKHGHDASMAGDAQTADVAQTAMTEHAATTRQVMQHAHDSALADNAQTGTAAVQGATAQHTAAQADLQRAHEVSQTDAQAKTATKIAAMKPKPKAPKGAK